MNGILVLQKKNRKTQEKSSYSRETSTETHSKDSRVDYKTRQMSGL